VLRINDNLVWIRIRGSMPLTNGSGCGSCYFYHWPSRRQQKTNLKKSFSSYYFLHLPHFSNIKSQKKSQNSRNRVSYYFCLTIEGCGSGSIPLTNGSESRRPKNMWIRIRNTGFRCKVKNMTLWRCGKSSRYSQEIHERLPCKIREII
jgi:hypothetical protein